MSQGAKWTTRTRNVAAGQGDGSFRVSMPGTQLLARYIYFILSSMCSSADLVYLSADITAPRTRYLVLFRGS